MSRSATPVLLCGLAVLAGCGGGPLLTSAAPPSTSHYSPSDVMRVMLSPPGTAGEAASRIVSARVVEVLQQTHADVALVPTWNEEEAIAAARKAKATFLVSPTILEWTDNHAPPLTADRVKVRLDLRDPGAGDVVSSLMFENTSSLLTVVDTPPEALLDSSFDRAVRVLITTGSGQEIVRQPHPSILEHVPVDEQKFPRQ
jgi:hypothetical protein